MIWDPRRRQRDPTALIHLARSSTRRTARCALISGYRGNVTWTLSTLTVGSRPYIEAMIRYFAPQQAALWGVITRRRAPNDRAPPRWRL